MTVAAQRASFDREVGAGADERGDEDGDGASVDEHAVAQGDLLDALLHQGVTLLADDPHGGAAELDAGAGVA